MASCCSTLTLGEVDSLNLEDAIILDEICQMYRVCKRQNFFQFLNEHYGNDVCFEAKCGYCWRTAAKILDAVCLFMCDFERASYLVRVWGALFVHVWLRAGELR